MIAHVAGLPFEELAAMVPAAGAVWFALRSRAASAARR